MAYRNDIDALAARKTALEFEVAQKQRERDLAGMLLDEAKARAKLPILDNIRVATPCSADWNEMVGDERVRHCMKCNKDVFNLSQMTRDDAEQLLRDKQGNLCARYFQRADGTIITSDCAVGKQQRRRRRVVAASAAALLAGGGAFTWKLMTHTERLDYRAELNAGATPMMGGMQGPRVEVTIPAPPKAEQEPTAYLGGVSMEPDVARKPVHHRVHAAHKGAK
jgi:hypothetical protein